MRVPVVGGAEGNGGERREGCVNMDSLLHKAALVRDSNYNSPFYMVLHTGSGGGPSEISPYHVTGLCEADADLSRKVAMRDERLEM